MEEFEIKLASPSNIFYAGQMIHGKVVIHLSGIFSGILRDKTIQVTLMYIPNDDKHSYPFCKSKLLVETTSLQLANHNSIKVPKVMTDRTSSQVNYRLDASQYRKSSQRKSAVYLK